MQDEKKIINKILLEFKQPIAKRELGKLRTAARELFYFVNEFRKLHSVRDQACLYFLNNQKQKTETCSIYNYIFTKLCLCHPLKFDIKR